MWCSAGVWAAGQNLNLFSYLDLLDQLLKCQIPLIRRRLRTNSLSFYCVKRDSSISKKLHNSLSCACSPTAMLAQRAKMPRHEEHLFHNTLYPLSLHKSCSRTCLNIKRSHSNSIIKLICPNILVSQSIMFFLLIQMRFGITYLPHLHAHKLVHVSQKQLRTNNIQSIDLKRKILNHEHLFILFKYKQRSYTKQLVKRKTTHECAIGATSTSSMSVKTYM